MLRPRIDKALRGLPRQNPPCTREESYLCRDGVCPKETTLWRHLTAEPTRSQDGRTSSGAGKRGSQCPGC